ncbi:MAG: Trm112 family protein [Dehalococcoidia bacterium]|nr:Trm112 family protein [Dehalococcoidia bacterium]
MKKGLVEILACPTCKSPLSLIIKEEKAGEVMTGSLYCPKCAIDYPIVDAIPNLLPRTPAAKS